MITKIELLENIGKFTDFEQESDFLISTKVLPTNCNIIFGFNGSGKSTISKVISLFGDNSFTIEKNSIFSTMKRNDSDQASIKIGLQSGKKLIYSEQTNIQSSFYIFNSDFVDSYVSNGVKKFNGANASLTTPELKAAEEKIKELKKEEKTLKDDFEKLDSELKRIKDRRSVEFNKNISNKKMPVIKIEGAITPKRSSESIDESLKGLISDYQLSINQPEIFENLNTISSFVFSKHGLDLAAINGLLNKTIQQVSKGVLEDRIKQIKDLFSDENYKQSAEKWFRYGKSILDTRRLNRCPICDNDISVNLDSILASFNSYFDESYEDFLSELNNQINIVNSAIVSMEKNELNVPEFGLLYGKYREVLLERPFKRFDFLAAKTDLYTIRDALIEKVSNISIVSSISGSVFDNLSLSDSAADILNSLKDFAQKTLSIKTRSPDLIVDDVKKSYKDLVLLEFDNLHETGALNKYNEDKVKFGLISTQDPLNENGIRFWENKRRKELENIKAESKGIAKFLKILGIDSFTIDLKDKPGEEEKDIIVTYYSSTSEKNKKCLSDGEKTALGFAYFLSKYESELDEGEQRESVVVIDDPISSLDENRLYGTAHLIKDLFNNVKQLIVLSHNFLFLKFFNSAYTGCPKCFFIEGDKLINLPEEMENFETPYFYMLKEILKYIENQDNHKSAQKYLPNFVRRVLETFISFKFAIKSGRQRTKSPGLAELKLNVNDIPDLTDDDKEALIKKIGEIIEITDKLSHGSLQLTDENAYISKNQLLALTRNSIDVINAIDSVHGTKISETRSKPTDDQKLSIEEQKMLDDGTGFMAPESKKENIMATKTPMDITP